ncbi:MAG: hypothetical protein JO053_03230 [Acidobacteria bacterium]|nr:hypothetical protein [Acidobacteriota bacterium]
MPINLSNEKGRDAVVAFETLLDNREIFYVDKKKKETMTRRVLKSDIEHDLGALVKNEKQLKVFGKKLVEGDPEIDMETFGMFLADTSRVYVSKKGIVRLVEEFEVIKKPDGTVRDRRPRVKHPQNINVEGVPIRWTGKFIKKDEALVRFVFTNKKQIVHINGLTFDFLYDMAKDLAKRDSFMLLRGGDKGNEPIVMNRGGKQYNAFLEGRVKGSSYCLILHLSNLELKRPEEADVAQR